MTNDEREPHVHLKVTPSGIALHFPFLIRHPSFVIHHHA